MAFPINFWTFRNWEAMAIFKLPASVGYFYKRQHAQMIEQGEFAPYTPYAVKESHTWATDGLGYRNEAENFGSEIVFVGDSYTAGASLDQTETLSSITQQLSGKKTSQIAPASFNDFKQLLELGLVTKPRVLIFCVCERQIPGLEIVNPGKTPRTLHTIGKQFKKIISQNDHVSTGLTYADRLFKNAAFRYIKSAIVPLQRMGIQSSIEPRIFFFAGKGAPIQYDSAILAHCTDVLFSYQQFCLSQGIRFVFLPGPNKESLYYEWVPLVKQPDFLHALHQQLQKKGIFSIDALELFTQNKQEGMLYCFDDSHWNGKATRLLISDMLTKMKENHIGE